MRAIQILRTGGPEVLTSQTIPDPIAGPGEALIRIAVAGVNFIDTYLREGRYPAKLPYTLGRERSFRWGQPLKEQMLWASSLATGFAGRVFPGRMRRWRLPLWIGWLGYRRGSPRSRPRLRSCRA